MMTLARNRQRRACAPQFLRLAAWQDPRQPERPCDANARLLNFRWIHRKLISELWASLRCFHRKLSAFMLSAPHYAVIRVYDEAGNVIETHEHKGELKEW